MRKFEPKLFNPPSELPPYPWRFEHRVVADGKPAIPAQLMAEVVGLLERIEADRTRGDRSQEGALKRHLWLIGHGLGAQHTFTEMQDLSDAFCATSDRHLSALDAAWDGVKTSDGDTWYP